VEEEVKKKGGIWVGRRGLSQGCDHNQPARDEICRGLQNQLNDLFALLREVEAAIDAAGSVLSISQLQGSLANTVFGGGE